MEATRVHPERDSQLLNSSAISLQNMNDVYQTPPAMIRLIGLHCQALDPPRNVQILGTVHHAIFVNMTTTLQIIADGSKVTPDTVPSAEKGATGLTVVQLGVVKEMER